MYMMHYAESDVIVNIWFTIPYEINFEEWAKNDANKKIDKVINLLL